MVAEFKKRREYMVATVNKIPGISCLKPAGAFYVFASIQGLIGKEFFGKKITDSRCFWQSYCWNMLKLRLFLEQDLERRIISGYLMLVSSEQIEKGLARIAKFVAGN